MRISRSIFSQILNADTAGSWRVSQRFNDDTRTSFDAAANMFSRVYWTTLADKFKRVSTHTGKVFTCFARLSQRNSRVSLREFQYTPVTFSRVSRGFTTALADKFTRVSTHTGNVFTNFAGFKRRHTGMNSGTTNTIT